MHSSALATRGRPADANTEESWEARHFRGASLTYVQLVAFDGASVHGRLKAVSRGVLQVLAAVPFTARGEVRVTIAHCAPLSGEVLYCARKPTAYQLGIAFAAELRAEVVPGGNACITTLAPPFDAFYGRVLDVSGTSVSVLSGAAPELGAWVRVDSDRAVLFGEVGALVRMGEVFNVGVQLDAVFPGAAQKAAASGV
jgi:hypothetical protein